MAHEVPNAMVDRVVLILGAFARGGGSLTLTEIVELTDVPRSSAHRILTQLTAARWVDRSRAGYRLGLGIFELGSLVAHRNRIVDAARPYMQELSGGRYVTHLAILDGRDVVYLDKVGGGFAGRLPSRVGGRLPAHATGVGKAILAHLGSDAVDEYLDHDLRSRTTSTISTADLLRVEFSRIRASGYALDRGESVPGVACVAAPIYSSDSVCAAISVCGLAQHVASPALPGRVRAAATAISRRIGGEVVDALSA